MSVVLSVLSEWLPESPGLKIAMTAPKYNPRVLRKPASECEWAIFPAMPSKLLHLFELQQAFCVLSAPWEQRLTREGGQIALNKA